MSPSPLFMTPPIPAPLHGITVLDLSRLLPGPYATQVLADLGATVIKVEDPQGGDYLRHMPPLCGDTSAMFLALNRGKESVALDLKNPNDHAAFLQLVKDAHVVVESFRPGVMARLGLGFDTLVNARPGLILCSISGYGQEGPDAHRAGHDLNYVARAGVLGFGAPGSMPAVQLGDIGGGSLWAVVQILAALRRAEATGAGAHLDVSMTDGSWAFLTMSLAASTAGGQAMLPGRDLLNGGVPCYRAYQSRDGVAVAVGALEPKFWSAFCNAIGRPDLTDRGLESGPQGDEVAAQLQAMFGQEDAAHWRTVFDAHDCCVEVANAPHNAHRVDRTLRTRGLTVMVDQPGAGPVELPATPLRFHNYRPDAARPAPALGQHNAQRLRK